MLAIDTGVLNLDVVPPGMTPIGTFGGKALLPYDYFPRVFLAAEPRYFPNPEAALDYVLSATSDVLAHPAVEHNPRETAGRPKPLEETETAKFVRFSPNRVELEVQASHPRTLVLCEMFEKNWQARVNGAPTPIMPANYVFRAVAIPAGASTVVFDYKPKAFYRGATVTAVSLAGLMLFAAASGRLPRRRTRPAETGNA